jgi:hypothetical protein
VAGSRNLTPWNNGGVPQKLYGERNDRRTPRRLRRSKIKLPTKFSNVNSTLTIGSVSGTLVSDDEKTANPAQEITYDNETAPTRDAVHLCWSSFRFAEFFEGILAILTGLYLIGAVGFGAILLFYTLHH